MQMRLNCLNTGCRGTVTKIETAESLKRRLYQFGLVPGTPVTCLYRNCAGDLMALELRGSMLALHARDAGRIWVKCP